MNKSGTRVSIWLETQNIFTMDTPILKRFPEWPAKSDSEVIVAIGDPHIHTKDLDATALMIQEVIDICKNIKPDAVVVLGDVYHAFERLNVGAETRGIHFLSALNDIAPLVVLVGNHDLRNNKTMFESEDKAVHPFMALKKWKNTLVCDVPKLFKVGNKLFCGVPYLPVGEYHQAVKSTREYAQALEREGLALTSFFSHQEFRGVRSNVGVEKSASQTGDVWSVDDVLNASGHFHDAQIVQANLIYVGTSRQIHWGESPDKAVGVFSYGTKPGIHNPEKVPQELNLPLALKGHFFNYYRVPMKTVPRKLEVSYVAQDFHLITAKIAELINSILLGSIDLYKIKIQGTREEIEYIKTLPLIRQAKNEYSERIVCDYTVLDVKSQFIAPELVKYTGTTKCFNEILFDLLKQDEETRLSYEEIFNKRIY